jgi:four helix bundle protein
MATFKRFEDIEAWQGARGLAQTIYQVTNEGAFARDFGLRDQIRRAAVSVMANIAEGFGRGGNREFLLFLGNARGSLAEVRSHLYVAMDSGLLSQAVSEPIFERATRIEAQISGLMRYLGNSDMRGARFAPTDQAQSQP